MKADDNCIDWVGVLFLTVVLMGVVGGAVWGCLSIQTFWGVLFGVIAGGAAGFGMAILGIGMGIKEPIESFGGYLTYALINAWIILTVIILLLGSYMAGAAVCIIPAILLTISSMLSSRRIKRSEKPKLDRYMAVINALFDGSRADDPFLRTRGRLETLSILKELGSQGKASVISFLHAKQRITTFEDPIDLSGADLQGIDLAYKKLSRICLDNSDLSKAHLQAVELPSASLARCNLSRSRLRYANLSRANLSEVDLSRADLMATDLSAANLAQANLRGARLDQAVLLNAELRGADCSKCNLTMADLSGADLQGASFVGAILWRVKLHGALLDDAATIAEKWRNVRDIQSRSQTRWWPLFLESVTRSAAQKPDAAKASSETSRGSLLASRHPPLTPHHSPQAQTHDIIEMEHRSFWRTISES